MNQDYYDIANSIGTTIAKCSKALTEDQQTVLAGALAVYLYKAESELLELKKSREGWKLVPIEPTYEMLKSVVYETDALGCRSAWPSDIYRSMLEAAPKEQS